MKAVYNPGNMFYNKIGAFSHIRILKQTRFYLHLPRINKSSINRRHIMEKKLEILKLSIPAISELSARKAAGR